MFNFFAAQDCAAKDIFSLYFYLPAPNHFRSACYHGKKLWGCRNQTQDLSNMSQSCLLNQTDLSGARTHLINIKKQVYLYFFQNYRWPRGWLIGPKSWKRSTLLLSVIINIRWKEFVELSVFLIFNYPLRKQGQKSLFYHYYSSYLTKRLEVWFSICIGSCICEQ